jgi:hypothetical protein
VFDGEGLIQSWARNPFRLGRTATLQLAQNPLLGGASLPALRYIHPFLRCLPSMHVVWALLLAWNARRRWLRVSLWLFALVTMVSIISTREHYFVDLLAAVPYTAAVQWAAQRQFAFRRPWLPALERRM